jgi:predicted site-specific integrase-resolvase
MDLTNRISRAEIAEQLGVQTQTIAKWERTGRFPAPKEYVSDRVILYDRDEVRAVLESRLIRKAKRVPPRRT